jgi:DNA-binding transcriptional regulator YhcF (GntR family)
MIRFGIDLTSPVPAYQQVIQAVKIEVLSGRLKSGDKLPPIRELATDSSRAGREAGTGSRPRSRSSTA